MPRFFPGAALGPPARRDRLGELHLHAVEDAADPRFDLGHGLLDRYFGARGELEPRDRLARLLAAPHVHRGIHVACPMLLVESAAGEVLAVFNRYFSYEPATGLFAGLDGNAWVDPARRGQGIATLGLAALWELGRRRLADFGAAAARRSLDLGDLEPPDPGDPDALDRAVVWGRAGAAVLPHPVFPLALVGMAAEGGTGPAAPVPVLAMFGRAGGGVPLAAIDKATLHVLAHHVEAAHAWAGPGAGLEALTARLQAAVAAAPLDPIPLLPLPRSREDEAAIARLYALSRQIRR